MKHSKLTTVLPISSDQMDALSTKIPLLFGMSLLIPLIITFFSGCLEE